LAFSFFSELWNNDNFDCFFSPRKKVISIDIEGSEYHVLNEAVDSGVLCELAKNNNNAVDIYIEYHSPKVMNEVTKSAKRFVEEVRPYLMSEECGGSNISLYERMKYFE
jgi:hypothetical protein